MRICYGILSSSTNGAIVGQLASTLGGTASIVVHHDFSQQPKFLISSDSNTTVISNYVRTEWGQWSQAEAIIRLLSSALKKPFDYFQLLSETCLPIRPIREFESFLEEARPDACIGLIPLRTKANDRGTLNYAHRYLATGFLSRPIVRRLARLCLDRRGLGSPRARELDQGLSLINRNPEASVLSPSSILLNAALRIAGLTLPFTQNYPCHVGSTWFCLSRPVVEHVLKQLRSNQSLIQHFRNTLSPDESVIHTIVGNSHFQRICPINHFISWTERENGPDSLTLKHLPLFAKSGRFFARKFSASADDPLRQHMISALIATEHQR